MANPVLNANAAVATWHEKAQRCGFKFLVGQLMGYLTGGPQVYTGRDLALSHKHLNISGGEWASFMDNMLGVCGEFGLPAADVADLEAVVASMKEACVIGQGERVPPNPGKAVPRGNSLYARLGGVYPIALIADRLVDAMLGDKATRIPLDGQKRSEAGPFPYPCSPNPCPPYVTL